MSEINAKYQSGHVINIIERYIVNKNWSFLDKSKRYFVITDKNLSNLYNNLLSTIPNIQILIELKPGENNKSIKTYQKIISALIKLKAKKNDVLIAFGGGVICDITGFVASTYLKGIEYITIPTTLYAQASSAIGGKCSINFEGINNIGAIYHPNLIITDPNLLSTLSQEEFNKGIIQILKYALLKDENLFNVLMKEKLSYDSEIFIDILTKAIKIKTFICEKDEFDHGIRKLLNFGHTYGNIIYNLSKEKISYQEAIGIGMYYELNDINIKEQVKKILSMYNLSSNISSYNINFQKYLKKESLLTNKELYFIDIKKIGKAKLD